MSNSERILTNNQIIKDNNDDLAIILDKINRIPPPLDTSDATATAEDILKDKTAYVKGEKITGTFEGGGGTGFTGHVDVEGLRQIGWTDEDIDYFQQNVFWNEENDFMYEIDEMDIANSETSNARFLNASSNVTKFTNYNKLIAMPQLDTSNITAMYEMFSGCYSLIAIPQLNTSNVTNMGSMFSGCYSLKMIPQLDTSNVTNISRIFSNCFSLRTIPQFVLNNRATNITYLFSSCYSLIEIPQLDTSNVTNMGNMFTNCYSLRTIPQLDTSKVTSISTMLSNCYSLKEIGGFTNLGQAYLTTQSENYTSYKLDLSASVLLTHDSLMNVINNLYDIKSKGCKNQALVLGATNLAKLTEEEINIARNKRLECKLGGV